MEVGACQGASSSSPRSKRRLFIASQIYSNVSFVSKVSSLMCMTTPCSIADWPLVMWKGSGAHVPLSVQAKLLEPLLAATP
ncbi:unnamed protein product [Spirodela intermedia]|uniref:Uncharacterized protein n=1 Tax=Spirodela intermedia TaxID=51605 RepID=A0A7I8JIT3_SPIIN|nr:unnamed protein product [Spirodela intermedia]CAA6670020.1 unnamed protein product [Spirodela intermedia]